MADSSPSFELINVHQVSGPADVVRYLKSADHDYVEGLFYNAKRYGRAAFRYASQAYELVRNRDFSFSVQLDAEQELTPESFA